MNFSDLNLNATYSYADYLTWKFEERLELIKGKIFNMSPAPLPKHQVIVANLHLILGNFFKKTKCKVYLSPFDVRLPKLGENDDNQIFSVVQPDIFILCDPTKIDGRGCLGAPDFIIEIVSKSTGKKDLTDKYELYQSNGVREYWVVFPNDELVNVYLLGENNQFKLVNVYQVGEQIPLNIFPELVIDSNEIFEN